MDKLHNNRKYQGGKYVSEKVWFWIWDRDSLADVGSLWGEHV